MFKWLYSRVMFKTRMPDPDWMNRLRAKQFTHDTVFHDSELEALKRKLLTYGGYGVVLAHDEPDLDEIMTRGKIESGCNPLMLSGTPSDCHTNAYRLWKSDPENVRLCTGWALSDDGLWRQHSWVIFKGKIAETTVQRVAYFGFELTDEEAETWAN